MRPAFWHERTRARASILLSIRGPPSETRVPYPGALCRGFPAGLHWQPAPLSRTLHHRGYQPPVVARQQSNSNQLRPGDLGLGQLFVHTRDAVVVGNVTTGRIAPWNPAAERLLGWTRETARAESNRQAAEEALRRQWRLLQEGADDLRRELRRLQRSTQRLAKEQSAARRASLVCVVGARTDKVRRMFDELILSAAVEADALELRPERVNLVPLVGRVVAEMRSRATPCRLNVAMPQGLTALVDPARIEQVIRTLLEQAMARNPRGCWIDVELKRPLMGLARLEVRDVGRPVSDAARRRLERSMSQRGLALCRSIVERHGGTLVVELDQSAAGGVRIVITLPTQRGRVPATSGSS